MDAVGRIRHAHPRQVARPYPASTGESTIGGVSTMGNPISDAPSPFDVVIVGAGIVGCAIAHELSQFRLDVALVDREADVGFGTSKANSGIIHAGHHSSPDTLKGRLEWEGNQRWGPLADRLDIGFARIGDITVAFDADDLGTLEDLRDQALRTGVTGVEMWSADMLRAREPNLSTDLVGALSAPTAAVVNPYEACFALAESAAINGVIRVLGSPVTAIVRSDEGFEVTTLDRTLRTRFVVNAAGLGADRIEAMVGLQTFTLSARKGEEYLLDKRLRGLVQRIVFPCPTPTSKGILVIPTFDGTLMVGPTALETDDRDDLTTTTDGAEEVFAAVQRLVPSISAGDCIAEFAGVRAVSSSGDFVVGATHLAGFLNAAGIQSPGLTAAPALAELIRDELSRQGLALEPDADRAERTAPPTPIRSLDRSDQATAAESDPSFGRVVCRCELVTEGEIVDAIQRGGGTLDGIKFRTRAGMGRCQGGFCTWRVMQLISRELGIPMSEVTKRGGDSWLVLERNEAEAQTAETTAEVMT